MQTQHHDTGPILRVFEVHSKPGCAEALINQFASTSAAVVAGKPGNKGYFFGHGLEQDADYVVFTSVWENLDAIKSRFGEDWQASFLPPGYEALIERCSVRHVALGAGWHVTLAP